MSGWIAISRGIFKHEFFAREPMSEREAWIWMIAHAAWEDTQHRVGSDMLDVPRGSFFCTLRELQQAWGWGSDKRVRNFLKRTQEGRMADVKTDAKKTHITICNYDEFQNSGRKEDATGTQGRARNGRTKETINNKQREANASLDARVSEILCQIVDADLAQNFVAFRREMKKPITERSASAMVKQLAQHHAPAAVLLMSISNGWQGIFPHKVQPVTAINGGQYAKPASRSEDRMRAFLAGARSTS